MVNFHGKKEGTDKGYEYLDGFSLLVLKEKNNADYLHETDISKVLYLRIRVYYMHVMSTERQKVVNGVMMR